MATMLALSRLSNGHCLWRQSYPWAVQCMKPASASATKPGESFWDKNDRLKRPVSPHLSIYKPQMTWMMSLTHRTTGLALSGMLTSFSVGTLLLTKPFPVYIDLLQSMHLPVAAIFLGKCCIAFPLVFHYYSGIRHLVWDTGVGFNLKTLYQSAYAVIIVAGLVTLAVASL